MADTSNLSNFLGDVADAIRTKKGTTETIPAANFDTEIASINTLKGEEVIINPTTSVQVVEPSEGKNAITKATVEAVTSDIDSNIVAENIKSGVTILGVDGTLTAGIDTSDATATANDIAKNKTAYVNGEKVTGNVYDLNSGNWMVHTIRLYGQDMLSFTNGSSSVLVRENGSFVANFNEIAPVIGLTADKIKKGETILGITGTYEGDSPITTEEYNTAVSTANDILGEEVTE